jgi:hypothetical protein
MKKHVLHLNLIKTLINSDFLFLEQKNDRNSRLKALNISTAKKNSVIYLDPLETIKTLKQLIRILSFQKKYPHLNTNLHFFLNDENTILSSLLKKFLSVNVLESNFSFDINSDIVKLTKSKKNTDYQLGVVLNKRLQQDKNFFKKQINNDTFLFFKINSQIEINQNAYKLFNDLNDYKKSLFFISFLRQLLLNLHLAKKHAISKKI